MPSIYTLLLVISAIALFVAIIASYRTKNYKPVIAVFIIITLAIIAQQVMYTLTNTVKIQEISYDKIRIESLNTPNAPSCAFNLLDSKSFPCLLINGANDFINMVFGTATNGIATIVQQLTGDYLFQIKTDYFIKIFDTGLFLSLLGVCLLIFGICFTIALFNHSLQIVDDDNLQYITPTLYQKFILLITVLPRLVILPLFHIAIVYAFSGINVLLASDKFAKNFSDTFMMGGIANMVGGSLIITILITILFLILAIIDIKYNFELLKGTLSSMFAVSVSPISPKSHDIVIKDTIATCIALIIQKFYVILAGLMFGQNLLVNLVVVCIGIWCAIKARSEVERFLQNYMLSMDLSILTNMVDRGMNKISRIKDNWNKPVQTGTEKVKSFSYDLGDNQKGYTFREKPIMSTKGAILKQKLMKKIGL